MGDETGDHCLTTLGRFQYWATRTRPRFAAVAAGPVAVVLGGAAVPAGLGPGLAAAVAVGGALIVAVIALLIVSILRLHDPELRALSAAETAIVRRAVSSPDGAAAVATEPRLEAVAARTARHQLLVLRRMRPLTYGIALLLVVIDVYLVARGDWSKGLQLVVPVLLVTLNVVARRRLRRVLDVLEVRPAEPPAAP